MEQELIHEQLAAYALDALDDSERRDFDDHLASCDQCRAELEGLRDAAAALAYVPEGPAPPPALRDRVLKQVHSDRPSNVVPLRRQYALPAVATFAAAAAAAAIVLAVWGSNLSSSRDRQAEIAHVLATGKSHGLGPAQVVVGADRNAVVIADAGPAPKGKTYELWVIQGESARPAGLFNGNSIILLDGRVPRGAHVGLSVEKSGGAKHPTHIIGESIPI